MSVDRYSGPTSPGGLRFEPLGQTMNADSDAGTIMMPVFKLVDGGPPANGLAGATHIFNQ